MKHLPILSLWFFLSLSLALGEEEWSPISVPGAWEAQADGRFAELDGFA